MKTLYVIRHAKSSWDNEGLPDFDRPLNERGKTDAPRMGKRLKEKEVHPDLLLSSPARRAYSTSKRIAKVLGYNKENIQRENKLYHASDADILKVLTDLPDKFNTVMIFGHNPGLTDFVNLLNDKKPVTDNIPTCGVVAFEFSIQSWSEISFRSGKLLFFDFPRSKD
jgi:phosphohistidine phosphatase